jgi:hypothetical protein
LSDRANFALNDTDVDKSTLMAITEVNHFLLHDEAVLLKTFDLN